MSYRRNVPESSAMTGTYDTSDTAGPEADHTSLRGVTHAFDVAEAADLAWARRGMDPDDTDVPSSAVTTSPGLTITRGDPEEDKRRVAEAADRSRHALEDAGFEVDEKTGHVKNRGIDPTQPAQNLAASLGPMTTVDDPSEDRSAG